MGTYFRDAYSSVIGRRHKKSWEKFYELKNVDSRNCSSDYYDVSVNKSGIKWRTSLRFYKNKSQINFINPYGILGICLAKDCVIMKDRLLYGKALQVDLKIR